MYNCNKESALQLFSLKVKTVKLLVAFRGYPCYLYLDDFLRSNIANNTDIELSFLGGYHVTTISPTAILKIVDLETLFYEHSNVG